MATLTRELQNENSLLFQWFDKRHTQAGNKLINHHNEILMQHPAIGLPSYPQGFDYALAGTAFIYAFRIKMGWLTKNNPKTVASFCTTNAVEDVLLSVTTDDEIAVAALLLAIFEQRYRTGRKHKFEEDLFEGILHKRLFFQNDAIMNTIADLKTLIATIPNLWSDSSYLVRYQDTSITDNKIFINATFPECHFMNADAQQIVNGVLIKCFSTKSRRPFNKYHFWQQIAYALLDCKNQYKISHVCWYYTRQRVIFMRPINTLFKRLSKTREEFYEMLLRGYLMDQKALARTHGGFWDGDKYISYRG